MSEQAFIEKLSRWAQHARDQDCILELIPEGLQVEAWGYSKTNELGRKRHVLGWPELNCNVEIVPLTIEKILLELSAAGCPFPERTDPPATPIPEKQA